MAVSSGASAVEEIVLTAGPVQGRGWSLERMVTRLRLNIDAPSTAAIQADGLQLPGPAKAIERVSATCDRLSIEDGGIECRGGELRVRTWEGAVAFSPARFSARYGQNGFSITLEGLKLGAGVIDIAFEGSGDGFSVHADGKALPVPALLRLFDLKPAGLEVDATDGAASVKLRWLDSKAGGDLSAVLSVEQLTFSDAPGLNAGETLGLNLNLEASRVRGPWRFMFDASLSAGQIYLHPVFVDAGGGALHFEANGEISEGRNSVYVEDFSFRHQGVGEIGGSAALSLEAPRARIDRLDVQTKQLSLSSFHAVYIKPWLVDSVFSRLEIEGDAEAGISWSPREASDAVLRLEDLSLKDGGDRFAVEGLSGEVHWRKTGAAKTTRVGFERARFYRIDLGEAALAGTFSGSSFRLSAPLDLPLLGGALHVAELEAAGLGGEQLSWRMRGALDPVSLELLTARLEWPSFSGSLAGEIPSLRYADGEIGVDGTLVVRAFDGRVEIDGLKVTEPFGVVPRVGADIVVEDISLGALTRTFSFGKIEGRLSGRIDDLILVNWRPAAFDARFATPKNDKSRHRISQRAVKNLAKLGGAGEILTSTFLKFLESFSYDRLGISCRLSKGVCEMGGVEDAERGYYIVKGGGLPPRIDVFGFNTLVDWSTLVERLKAVTRAEEAVIR